MPIRARALAALALALVACAGAEREREAAPHATADTSALMAVPGRLLVLGTDGSVFTLAPDGSDRITLAAAGPGHAATQPTWSPDGRRVAWVEFEVRDGIPLGRVAASRADGGDRSFAETGAPPFFLAWDPTSSRVAYLHGDARAGIALGIFDGAGGGVAEVIARGQPLYFDWAPDGTALFAHIGEGYLGHISLGGDARPLAEAGAVFRAPEWGEDGGLLYAARLPGGDALVVREAGGALRELVRFEGLIAFATSPGGRRVAYLVNALADAPAGAARGPNIALETSAGPVTAAEGLAVMDLVTGEVTLVTAEPVAAFFWSPSGDRLLYLAAEETLRGTLTRWWTWDDDGTVRLDAFAPSLEFARDYLPFFDQFARVSTPWSPDGSQFVYAGMNQDGEAGIWVQSADGAIPPILIADGVYAIWSP